MTTPSAFVSYSHDSPQHKTWVFRLASDLRAHGVDATLDQWDLTPGQDMAAFMERGVTGSTRVILVCTESYVRKAEAGSGGVGYERLIVTAELVQNIDTKKFIPVVRGNPGPKKIPAFLGPRLYIDFSNDAEYAAKLEELLREVLGTPGVAKPPLGPNPFSGSPRPVTPARTAGPTGLTAAGERLLDEAWFAKEHDVATAGISKVGLVGHMELRFALHEPIGKSQIELLNAVRKSEIHTFGWPIGVTLENRDEFRPRPYGDGIRAEIGMDRSALAGRPSYDYWALRANGDFYLLQSLFEDGHTTDKLFFNTRIVRVIEAFLFAANLYKNLGVPPETRISMRVTHRGLADRELTSSSPNREISPSTTREDVSQTEIVSIVEEIRSDLVEHVRKVAEPLFMLFDFKQFAAQVYDDIVRRFEAGHVS